MQENNPQHEVYMRRCLQLAALGKGYAAPNPVVGAVLVHEDIIIGEGYHAIYGEAHAEVNCINSVAENNRQFIPQAVLYVSLEPCSHYGKTPPCTDLIIRERIPRVIIGCIDSFSAVSGRGVEKLKKEKISVTVRILEKECREINRRFFTFFEKRRPYIILKWAETADGFIGETDGQPLKISNSYTDRLVHSWRSEEMSIMVGTATALHDDPRLTTRLWKGKSPVRIVLDRKLSLPLHSHLLDGTVSTIILNEIKNETSGKVEYIQLDYRQEIIPQVLEILFKKQLNSLIVEGGAQLLQSFIDSGLWDEARVIRGNKILYGGVRAPGFKKANLQESFFLAGDEIAIYKNL